MTETDEKLVQNFVEGDDKALAQLIDRYLNPLYNFVFQLTRDGQVAEDIVQETFVKVWKHAGSFDAKKKFSTWIYAIAKNASYDFLKKKKAIPFSAFENEDGSSVWENIEDGASLCAEALLRKMDDVKDAQEFLDTLSPQLKTIFLLHHVQGFSLVEVAEILGSPTNTIKSKYRRALLLLRQQFSSKRALKEAKTAVKG